jgi:predicted RNase H-like HicB family nuclease
MHRLNGAKVETCFCRSLWEHAGVQLTAIFEPAAEGGFVCWLEEMPNVQTQGDTLDKARENLRDAFQLSVEYLRVVTASRNP